MPKKFKIKANNTTIYLLNKLPTRAVNGKTPLKAWQSQAFSQALEGVWFHMLSSCNNREKTQVAGES